MATQKEKTDNYLAMVQSKLKAPKNQRNSFGNYNYRSCEDILEALKPIINPDGFSIQIQDEMVLVGNRIYVKATVCLTNGITSFCSTAYAREEETKKGMDASQITGAASSYARKYALNGLFAIDDTKDSDATNTHGKEIKSDNVSDTKPIPLETKEEKPVKVWLNEKQFNSIIERISKGETDIYQKTLDTFNVSKLYREKLKTAYDNAISDKNADDNELF